MTGQPESDADAAAVAALELQRAGVRLDASHAAQIDALRGALASDLTPTRRAEVQAALARELADGRRQARDEAERLTAEALAVARASGDRTLLAHCLFARHDVIWGPGTAGERAELGREMAELAFDEDPVMAFNGELSRLTALLELASPDALVALANLELQAQYSDDPQLGYVARTRRDSWESMKGADNEAAIAATYEHGVEVGNPDALGVYISQLVIRDFWFDDGPARMAAHQAMLGGHVFPPEYAPEEEAYLLVDTDSIAAGAIAIAATAPAKRMMFRWRALTASMLRADIAYRSGNRDLAALAYGELADHSGELAVIGGAACVTGPIDLGLGLAALALGDRELAARHLKAARSQARSVGAIAWLPRIEGLLGDRAAPESTPVLEQEGSVWRLSFGGRVAHTPDSKGVRDLARLVADPGVPVTALDLVGGAPQTGSDAVLDDAAKASYRHRMDALDREIDDASWSDDAVRRQRAEDERDALVAELKRAAGLGGRDRRLGDVGEKARSAVTARIRDAIRRIADVHPELGEHLSSTVRTGRECAYEP